MDPQSPKAQVLPQICLLLPRGLETMSVGEWRCFAWRAEDLGEATMAFTIILELAQGRGTTGYELMGNRFRICRRKAFLAAVVCVELVALRGSELSVLGGM